MENVASNPFGRINVMRMTAKCPSCMQVVSIDQSKCPHCNARLTQSRFAFVSLVLYGSLGIMAAFIVSLVIVPLAVIGLIIAFFARKKLHVISFDHPNDDDDKPEARVVDPKDTSASY